MIVTFFRSVDGSKAFFVQRMRHEKCTTIMHQSSSVYFISYLEDEKNWLCIALLAKTQCDRAVIDALPAKLTRKSPNSTIFAYPARFLCV